MKKEIIKGKVIYNFFENVLNVLAKIRRWSLHSGSVSYTELAKQSLNICIAYAMAKECEENGIEIVYERFPRIALKRAIQKTINGDIRDDHIDEICKLSEIEREEFDKLIEEKLFDKLPTFVELLSIDETWIETIIYKTATKLGTLIEFRNLNTKKKDAEGEICQALNNLGKDIQVVTKFFLEDSNEYKFFCEISELRHSIRWARQFRAMNCSVLEHLGEVAFISWMLSMEKNPNDEKLATHLFWCGAFHDLPERWTGDMASPVKDAVKGLRAGTELFENQMMTQYVYKVLPKHLGNAIKDVMMEEEKNAEYKKMLKMADYLSADFECYRNLVSGSSDKYFYNVIKEHKKHAVLSKSLKFVIKKMYKKVNKLKIC